MTVCVLHACLRCCDLCRIYNAYLLATPDAPYTTMEDMYAQLVTADEHTVQDTLDAAQRVKAMVEVGLRRVLTQLQSMRCTKDNRDVADYVIRNVSASVVATLGGCNTTGTCH